MPDDLGPEGWGANRRHVLAELARTSATLDIIREQNERFYREMLVEMATVKEKARAWGIIAGMLGAIVVSVMVQLILRNLGA